MQAPSRRIPQRLAAGSRSLSCSTVMGRVTAASLIGSGGPGHSGGGLQGGGHQLPTLGLGMISERETDIVDMADGFSRSAAGAGRNGGPTCNPARGIFQGARPTPHSMPASAPSSQPRSPSGGDPFIPSFALSLSTVTNSCGMNGGGGGVHGRGPGPCAPSLFRHASSPARKVSCGATVSTYTPPDAIPSGGVPRQRKS